MRAARWSYVDRAEATSAEVFGDDVVATAMIDHLVHHGAAIALEGESYRLTDRETSAAPHRGDRRNISRGRELPVAGN